MRTSAVMIRRGTDRRRVVTDEDRLDTRASGKSIHRSDQGPLMAAGPLKGLG